MLSVDERNVMKQHSVKLIDLEDRSRRNNLRIHGLAENEGENWETSERFIPRSAQNIRRN